MNVERIKALFRKWRDEFYTTGTEGLITALNVGVSIVTARLLLLQGKGELTAVLLWPNLFRGVGSFGLDHAIVYYMGQRKDDVGPVIGTTFFVALFQGMLIALAGYVALPHILSQYEAKTIVTGRLLFLFTPFMLVNGYLTRVVQGLGDFDAWNGIKIASKITYALGILFLWLADVVTVRSVVCSYILGVGVSQLLVVFVIRKRLRTWSVHASLCRRMFSYGFKNFLASLTGQANARLDQALISALLSPSQLGLYRIAASASESLRLFTSGFQGVIISKVSRAKSEVAEERILESLRVATWLLVVSGFALVVALPWLIPFMYGGEYRGAILSAQILTGAAVLFSLKQILYNAVRGLGRPEFPFYAEFAGAVVTVVGLYILLQVMGIEGAAITSLLAYGLSFSVVFALFWRSRSLGTR